MAETVKNSLAVWETWVRSLGWEDPLEEGIATHSGILVWRIPVDRGPWWAMVHEVAESEMTKRLSTRTCTLGNKLSRILNHPFVIQNLLHCSKFKLN